MDPLDIYYNKAVEIVNEWKKNLRVINGMIANQDELIELIESALKEVAKNG
jgi:hypothetical protein